MSPLICIASLVAPVIDHSIHCTLFSLSGAILESKHLSKLPPISQEQVSFGTYLDFSLPHSLALFVISIMNMYILRFCFILRSFQKHFSLCSVICTSINLFRMGPKVILAYSTKVTRRVVLPCQYSCPGGSVAGSAHGTASYSLHRPPLVCTPPVWT